MRPGVRALPFLLYFATRLYGLTLLPVFLDETNHMQWAVQVSTGDKFWQPWTYGKGLSIWLNALFVRLPGDVLWNSRCVTVAAGAVTLWALGQVARRFWGDRVALVASLLYVASPFALVYDRLVLTDSILATFATLSLLWSLRVVETQRPRDGVVLGLFLCASVLSKALGAVVLVIPLAAFVLCRNREAGRPVGLVVAYAVALSTIAGPFLMFLRTTQTVRVGLSSQGEPLSARLATNVGLASEWLWVYWTPPLLLLVFGALLLALRLRSGPALLLCLQAFGPLLLFLIISSVWFPRYLVLTIAPMVLLAAWVLDQMMDLLRRGRFAAVAPWLLVAAVVAPSLRIDLSLWSDPTRAPLPEVERWQYVTGWPSGYGVRETLELVARERDAHPSGITVVSHGPSRRTTSWALALYYERDRRVQLQDLDLNADSATALLGRYSEVRPTLVVVSQVRGGQQRPAGQPWQQQAELVLQTWKPDGTLVDQVYRLRRP